MKEILWFIKYKVELCMVNFYYVFKDEGYGAIKSVNVRVGVSANN